MTSIAPWCSGDDVLKRMGEDAETTGLSMEKIDGFAAVASEALFVLSGRQFKGSQQRTVLARVGRIRNQHTSNRTAKASLSAWWPVTKVEDLVGIPARGNSRELDATEWSWSGGISVDVPAEFANGQIQALLTAGQEPPAYGKLAAQALAVELAINDPDYDGEEDTRLPALTTSVSRQGVSQTFVSVLDVLKEGATGIHEVDQFTSLYNRIKARSRPRVRTMR
jgi:hypothetical protein